MTLTIDLTAATSAAEQAATYEGNVRDRRGFFTDTTLCIGCKACEVACKEWNDLPQDGYTFTGMSYDNTGELSGSTWRHVAFVEQFDGAKAVGSWSPTFASTARMRDASTFARPVRSSERSSERSSFKTTSATVAGTASSPVPSASSANASKPNREEHRTHPSGTMGKCTLCYDRLKAGDEPACAKACPTESIQYGNVDELRERAQRRLERVRGSFEGAQLYLENENDGIGGGGSIFLLLDRPEVYGLPPNPVVPTKHLPQMWRAAFVAAARISRCRSGCESARVTVEPMIETQAGYYGRPIVKPPEWTGADPHLFLGRRLGGRVGDFGARRAVDQKRATLAHANLCRRLRLARSAPSA